MFTVKAFKLLTICSQICLCFSLKMVVNGINLFVTLHKCFLTNCSKVPEEAFHKVLNLFQHKYNFLLMLSISCFCHTLFGLNIILSLFYEVWHLYCSLFKWPSQLVFAQQLLNLYTYCNLFFCNQSSLCAARTEDHTFWKRRTYL